RQAVLSVENAEADFLGFAGGADQLHGAGNRAKLEKSFPDGTQCHWVTPHSYIGQNGPKDTQSGDRSGQSHTGQCAGKALLPVSSSPDATSRQQLSIGLKERAGRSPSVLSAQNLVSPDKHFGAA